MKRKKHSFTGERPIFTGSPSIVQGGFNLDVTKQRFNVGDTIPAGTLAIYDEQTRLVSVVKTAKVVEVDDDDNKIVRLLVDEFLLLASLLAIRWLRLVLFLALLPMLFLSPRLRLRTKTTLSRFPKKSPGLLRMMYWWRWWKIFQCR